MGTQKNRETVLLRTQNIYAKLIGKKIFTLLGSKFCLSKPMSVILIHFIFQAHIMNPRGIYICDGTNAEAEEIKHKLEERGVLFKLSKYKNR